MCRRFIWAGNFAIVAWKTMFLEKEHGGLGLRDIRKWNDALLSKALWNMHCSKETMWCRWIHHYYSKRNAIWRLQPQKDHPPLLKRLLLIRNTLVQVEGMEAKAIDRIATWMQGGIFKTAEAYFYFAPSGQKQAWSRIVWSSVMPPKFSFHLWATVLRRLPTMDKLCFLEMDRKCKLCSTRDESISHLFFACSFTEDIWKRIRDWASIRRSMLTILSCLK